MNNGWIKLHRSLLDWEWYDDMNVRVVFIHCLLKANCKDIKYKGKDILRGSFATGVETLSKETGLTVAQIRVTLNKLKMTNEIAIKTSAEGSIILITNYDLYQSNDKPNDRPIASEMTNEQQTNDKPIATNKNNKNNKKLRSKEVQEEKSRPKGLLDVYFQFILLGLNPEKAKDKAQKFIDHYNTVAWKTASGLPIKDWKSATAGTWMKEEVRAEGFVKDHLNSIVEALKVYYEDRQEIESWDFQRLFQAFPLLFEDDFCFPTSWQLFLRGLKGGKSKN